MEEETLQGQAEVWKFMFGFVDSMALKSVVELRVADIIHAHGRPMALRHIISSIGTPSPDATCLERIMRLLVRRKMFAAYPHVDAGETLYGLTPSSRWILHDAELSLAPFVLFQNDRRALAPWHYLSDCVRDGGFAFEKAHGVDPWKYGSQDPYFNKIFNDGMKCVTNIILKAVLEGYSNGFEQLGSIVDVGGGTGAAVAEIVRAHPHIKGTNFDLPHVIATAPEYKGVTHVGGDMFDTIPNADAVFIKWILHDWSDENCGRILKNCRKSISKDSGKIIIVENVLDPERESLFGDIHIVFDMAMLAYTGGKERTDLEWKKLLNEAGFVRYNIIKIAALSSIIEAYTV